MREVRWSALAGGTWRFNHGGRRLFGSLNSATNGPWAEQEELDRIGSSFNRNARSEVARTSLVLDNRLLHAILTGMVRSATGTGDKSAD